MLLLTLERVRFVVEADCRAQVEEIVVLEKRDLSGCQ